MFSKSCEYAIRATIYVAVQSLLNQRTGLKDIAMQINSPEAFTAKILQQLVKRKIIDSIKGPGGGFVIKKKKMEKIKLAGVITAIDGNRVFKGCALGLHDCSEKMPCPLHSQYKTLRHDLKFMLDNTSILDLTSGLNKGITFLKI